MEDKNKKDINRRDFIKIVGISAATSTGLLYGCSSRYFLFKQLNMRRRGAYR